MLPRIDASDLIHNSFDFLPELLICLGIVVLLLVRLFPIFDRRHLGGWAMMFAGFALLASVLQWLGKDGLNRLMEGLSLGVGLSFSSPGQTGTLPLLYSNMLVYDYFTVYLRIFLYAFLVLVIWLTRLTGIPDREDSADFYVLLLGATLGMALMASATHLLMVFIAIEMASLPSYALAGFLKGRRESSEAALKYVVYGGGAAGVMLYGISLLSGKFGTGYLPDVAAGLVTSFQPVEGVLAFDPIVILGTFFILVGIAFKLAAVPFHFWCPDVFEGASAEVAGFLSVASKGAALAMLARITLTLAGLDPFIGYPSDTENYPFLTLSRFLVPTLAFFAALTATFGNLAAYLQTNLKRLLAYSTIAHAGYMLMGLCTLTRAGAEAVLFYLIAYLFMNLGAFAMVAFLRNQTHSEDLADFRGLVRRSPLLVVALSFFLLSLLGLPPLVGFAAKFQIFAVLYQDSQNYASAGQAGLSATLLGLLVVGGLNTVLSAVYYMKVLKVMILDHRAEDMEGATPTTLPLSSGKTAYAILLAGVVLVLGVLWEPVAMASQQGVSRFRKEAGKDAQATPLPMPPGQGGGAPGGPPGMGNKGPGKGKGGGKGKGPAKRPEAE